ncbi:MAG TPA: hypothetical protein EYG95_02365 [Campylobacterales bacterium]|nr:hypothetical protein [Campylobacterales bacterium]
MLNKTLLVLILLFSSSVGSEFKKGEKIYSIMCDKEKISALTYTDKDALKEQIKAQKLCGNLNAKKLDALTLFLTSKEKITTTKPLFVPEKSRCPVCGMFTAKYPKWVAIIEIKDGKKYYFDGVKDMMKFYFDPVQFHHKKEPLAKILVSDYYTLDGIDAKEAHYVIGSNIYGPMGEELIPFKTKADAKNFLLEHHGKKILSFDMIQEKFLY